MKTEITVSRPGSYSCLINHTLERRDFVVVAQPVFEKMDEEMVLNQQVFVGTIVQLDCEVMNVTVATVLWYRNGERLNGWKDLGRPKVNIGVQDCGLIEITCTAINSYGSIERNYSLYVAEISVEMSLIPNRTIVAGESFILRCTSAVDGYKVELKRAGNGNSLEKTTNRTVDHFVENAKETDEGKYTCIIQSGKCTKNSSIDVTIEAPPHITDFCVHFVSCSSIGFQVTCSANGDPTPIVTVTRISGFGPQLSARRYQSTTFREILNYEGQSSYSCSATNSHGTDTKTCHGRTGSKPQFATSSTRLLIQEGQSFALNCQTLEGTFQPVSITWFEDDFEKDSWNNSNIIWLKAELHFNGVSFKCSVSNFCGEVVKLFPLYVTAPCGIYMSPRMILHPLPEECKSGNCVLLPYGQSILLSALARCFPERPILSLWDEKQQELAATTNKDIVKERNGAHTTALRWPVSIVGNYSFRLHNVDVKSAIEVIALPSFVSPSVTNATHFVILTDDHRSQPLVCNARSFPGYPHVKWISNEMVHMPSRSTYTGDDGANYLRSNLFVNVAGTYTCQLKLSASQQTFIVAAAPMFETKKNDIALNKSASVGTAVQLNCKLLNSSESSITWYDDKREVVRWRDQNQPSLDIRLGDCGVMTFTCIAKNPYGSAKRTFVIHIRAVTVTTRIIPERAVVAGEKFSLQCIVEVNGYSIRWVRERVVIVTDTTGGRELTLTISRATKDNDGEYECIAQRESCISKSSLFLNVEVPPKVDHFCPSETRVVHCSNDLLKLTCKASGDPTPQVTMERNGFPLPIERRIRPGIAVYIEKSTEVGDSIIVCYAKSRHGQENKTCHFRTFSAPTFVNNFLAVLVAEGRPVHFKCQPVGKWLLPITNIIWHEGLVENKEWNNKQAVSWIATSKDHLKDYSCEVTNFCGSIIRRFSLYVAGVSDPIYRRKILHGY